MHAQSVGSVYLLLQLLIVGATLILLFAKGRRWRRGGTDD